MKVGSLVKLNPTSVASEELRQEVAALGDVRAEVLAVSGIGVCTLLLPEGVAIQGHSHPLPNNSGQHYLDLHQDHLEEVT